MENITSNNINNNIENKDETNNITENNNIDNFNTVFNELDNLYNDISSPSMKWEGVYKDYVGRFSESYMSGCDYYLGPSLIKSNANIFKKMKTIDFLKKYFSNHPLAPK